MTDSSTADATADPYSIREELPTPETFATLREAADMPPRSREGIEQGLPNSVYGVIVVHEPSGETVGMGRIVGDGGTVYQISDMAVHPDHQRQGLGTQIMTQLESYLETEAPPSAYVNLMADIDGFYESFGYEETRPASKGMYRRTE
ncbi:N-acetyltransferase GCN5 [Natrialba hulunbeirensis JCM 10989]|uniref:N-acetyltransferase GCN5 n=1 Tax=Natrialba hulunbeirensis JCM 10989 TaxID=1227493 RepID=L9ZWC1_9EURY|nr:GNAT family N-acetyltransferase [Natrialba hulunbeirensis]ELY90629.1 N-acetyltransferase GCN5 [Natrialba hulunbeirensis JCM 10989]